MECFNVFLLSYGFCCVKVTPFSHQELNKKKKVISRRKILFYKILSGCTFRLFVFFCKDFKKDELKKVGIEGIL